MSVGSICSLATRALAVELDEVIKRIPKVAAPAAASPDTPPAGRDCSNVHGEMLPPASLEACQLHSRGSLSLDNLYTESVATVVFRAKRRRAPEG